MTDAMIVAAPRGLRPVLGGLMDWSAGGLLRSVQWLEPDAAGRLRTINGLVLQDGRLRGLPIDAPLLAGGVERVRLLLLVPTWPNAEVLDLAAEEALQEAVRRASPDARITPIRVLLVQGQAIDAKAVVDRISWHNIIVSPEESAQPGGIRQLGAAASVAELAPVVAACVASLGGAWTGVSASPLDDQQTAPQGWPRLYRTHVRWLDARSAEAALREGLLHPMEIPPPTGSTGATSAVVADGDIPAITQNFAARLMEQHQGLFESPRTDPEQEARIEIGPLEAVRMFFSFLASMFRPVEWMRLMLTRAKAAVASAVGDAVFGDDSRYVVSFEKGSLARQEEALTLLESGLSRDREPVYEAPGDFSAFWRGFIEGALTLVDAGTRGTVQPVAVGGQRGVLPRTADCAPAPGGGFVLDPALGLAHGRPVVGHDRLGLRAIDAELDELVARDDGLGLVADRERARLRSWAQETRHSFTARVGGLLDSRIRAVGAEIKELLFGLASTDPGIEGRLAAQEKRLARSLLVILAIAVAAIIVTVVLGGLAVIGSAIAAWVVVGLIVCWFGSSLIAFSNGQRELFQELAKRRELVSRQEANEENLRNASRDLRRLLEAYRQFLGWGDVISTVVTGPFGVRDSGASVGAQRITGLPLNVRVAELAVAPDDQLRAVSLLKRSFYRTGWLTQPWEQVLGDVGRRLGADAIDLTERPDRIFSDAGGTGSRLDRWAALLTADGVGEAPGARAWREVASGLAASDRELKLIEHGRAVGVGGVSEPANTFVARSVLFERPGTSFDDRLLNDRGRVMDAHGVAEKKPLEVVDGLSRLIVRSDLGHGIEPHLLQRTGGGYQPEPGRGPLI